MYTNEFKQISSLVAHLLNSLMQITHLNIATQSYSPHLFLIILPQPLFMDVIHFFYCLLFHKRKGNTYTSFTHNCTAVIKNIWEDGHPRKKIYAVTNSFRTSNLKGTMTSVLLPVFARSGVWQVRNQWVSGHPVI